MTKPLKYAGKKRTLADFGPPISQSRGKIRAAHLLESSGVIMNTVRGEGLKD